jgi:hypothetical protein
MCCPCLFPQLDGISACFDNILPSKNAILRKLFLSFGPVLSGNACSHPTKLSVATLTIIKKKLEKNPTLTARQLKMRLTHTSVEEEEWSSEQADCCHLGPHEEKAKEESNTDSQPDEDEDEDGGGHY